MAAASAVINVSGEGKQREVLPVHVVLQIEDTRETSAGNLRFVPGAVGSLRRKQVTQATLNARPIEIATRTDAHDRPRRLRGRARTAAFRRRIVVGRAGLAPARSVGR